MAVTLTATDYLSMGDAAVLEFDPSADSFTICHWIKIGNLTGFASVFSKMLNSIPYQGWESTIFTDERPWFYAVQVWSTKAYRAKSLTALTLNTWQHVCWVWTPAGVTLYIDGISIALDVDTNTPMDASGHVAEIACVGRRNGVTGGMVGEISDVRLYNRALSVQEVVTIHTLKGIDHIISGLLFRMVGEEGAPATAVTGIDLSPNKLTCVSNGAPVYTPGPLRG
tara:strand:+ start:12505 stop:13179 length:675 start_codon:yes stop_codon:yes gene_type:complete